MIETVRFSVGPCSSCRKDVLLAQDLVGDRLVHVCVHCGELMPEGFEPRELGPASLLRHGYVVEGETGSSGCGDSGSGGCGACGL